MTMTDKIQKPQDLSDSDLDGVNGGVAVPEGIPFEYLPFHVQQQVIYNRAVAAAAEAKIIPAEKRHAHMGAAAKKLAKQKK